MLDIVFLAHDMQFYSDSDAYANLQRRFPFATFVEDYDIVDAHFKASTQANTSFFYVVDANFEIAPDFNFDYNPLDVDAQWVTRFLNGNNTHDHGVRLFHKDTFQQIITDKQKVDFVNNFGSMGIKDVDIIGAIHAPWIPDIFFFTHFNSNWRDYLARLECKYPVRVIDGDDIVMMHLEACAQSQTSVFYAIDAGVAIAEDFDFTQQIAKDQNWISRFIADESNMGMRLLGKDVANQDITEEIDFINNFGIVGVKDIEDIVVKYDIELDIIFIDVGESFADEHFNLLQKRFHNRVKRVSNVTGLWYAHKEASLISTTHMFYVVDADTVVRDTFTFSFAPNVWDQEYVYVWNSFCELTGLTYGNAGIKLLSKAFFAEKMSSFTDMTTAIGSTIANGITIIDVVASDNKFYEDEFLAWRGAFRECVKLASSTIGGQLNAETQLRLAAWQNINSVHKNANSAKRGVAQALAYVADGGLVQKVNDYPWLLELYNGK